MKIKTEFDFNERQQKLYDTLVFVSKMLFFGALLHMALFLRPDTYGLQSALAALSNFFLQFLGVALERNGALLISERSSYLVTQDCLGWKSMFAFTALVLSSAPLKEIKKHLKTVVIGAAALAAINIFRVATTIYLSYHQVISFEIIHTVFWKWGLTFVVLVFWFSWLKRNENMEIWKLRESLNRKARKFGL